VSKIIQFKKMCPEWDKMSQKETSLMGQNGGKKRMPNWTEEQKQAIYEKNSNLLVAAAAGSRKNSSISRKNNK
jgi:hypothetical protein